MNNTDQTGIPLKEGDRVALNPGMVDAQLVKLPSGLAMPGQQPGQQDFAIVQVTMLVPVAPNGVVMGVLKLPDLPNPNGGSVQ